MKSTFVGISTVTLSSPAPAVLGNPRSEENNERVLTWPEKRFLGSAADRLIPPYERWPRASRAGVIEYIDRRMAGPWGRGELLYRHGLFRLDLLTQPHNLEYAWAELFRRSINAINDHFTSQGTSFTQPINERTDAYFVSLEKGGTDLDGVPSNTFFEEMLNLTV